ncbi:hypothetical protein F5B22DRAFT_248426 [Xylaria bambusicola]|uniref:uncharacterized protein n=1 Tax=Xylaria bambusicola TaxID=326684 RepID=UPI0020072B62|nr:uncharacterized protein F5B22DRAFT_248426 [Xylaria bambusicola]KAI0513315.1 hypothetical protein F5B22DRAFT_248426 [Xylaria bambusicola]
MSHHLRDSIILIRLVILSLAIIGLAVAGLNSANARFAIILRNRARSGLTDSASTILDKTFASLMQNILVNTVVMAVISTAFAIFGIATATYRRWLRDNNRQWMCFSGTQVLLALVLIIIGGYLADYVNGFQSSFDKFGRGEDIPYYTVMYFGGIAEASYGALVIALFLLIYSITTGEREMRRVEIRREGAEDL